ncbi:hypothetical protein KFK14_14445 [Sphingobium phenoxybenzoativorans]|uniref:Uncharacterized protein n=1 Tax=Sphingobium phenoxybenzoativorans TaxID=1592790 RepID=A0A975KBM5_9SPHN|nr:hypothetical protein [Sphingobium phenoxybenzoativorans]QUT08431.1 hypothetical protein KFK14_14445 [Sphingobium phenoxybenzoativorans]
MAWLARTLAPMERHPRAAIERGISMIRKRKKPPWWFMPTVLMGMAGAAGIMAALVTVSAE